MSLDKRTWLAQAQQLSEGQSKRVEHVCGPGACMVIEHTEEGWRAYCHRCSDSGFEFHPQESLQQRLTRLAKTKEIEQQMQQSPALPGPYNREPNTWPLEARVWLYKAGLSNDEVVRLGAYWNDKAQRVIVPVMGKTKQPVFWQARNPFNDGRPKYLSPHVARQHIVAEYGQGDCLVLTEDLLSAYKVGRVTLAWALLGTKIPEPILARIAQLGKPVFVWLDPDWLAPNRPGQVAAAKIMKVLRSVGVQCTNIVSRADPKLLSTQEIRDALQAQE